MGLAIVPMRFLINDNLEKYHSIRKTETDNHNHTINEHSQLNPNLESSTTILKSNVAPCIVPHTAGSCRIVFNRDELC